MFALPDCEREAAATAAASYRAPGSEGLLIDRDQPLDALVDGAPGVVAVLDAMTGADLAFRAGRATAGRTGEGVPLRGQTGPAVAHASRGDELSAIRHDGVDQAQVARRVLDEHLEELALTVLRRRHGGSQEQNETESHHFLHRCLRLKNQRFARRAAGVGRQRAATIWRGELSYQ